MKLRKELNDKIVECIRSFIELKCAEAGIDKVFEKAPIRDGIFDLLNKYSVVLYYPISDKAEKNNGFLITDIPTNKGSQECVFINTYQTTEKQVFTAAHELGHVWKINSYVRENAGCEVGCELKEPIVSRFAAELLMPEEQFRNFIERALKDKVVDDKITVSNMLRVIASAMNEYYVPDKAVTLRMLEQGFISEEDAKILCGEDQSHVTREVLVNKLNAIIIEEGYEKLLLSNKKKWIQGLSEYLKTASDKHLLSAERIKRIRDLFDIPEDNSDKDLDNTFTLRG